MQRRALLVPTARPLAASLPLLQVRVLGRSPFHDTCLTTSGDLSYIGGTWQRDIAFAGTCQLSTRTQHTWLGGRGTVNCGLWKSVGRGLILEGGDRHFSASTQSVI